MTVIVIAFPVRRRIYISKRFLRLRVPRKRAALFHVRIGNNPEEKQASNFVVL
jgi:hypothetical protein